MVDSYSHSRLLYTITLSGRYGVSSVGDEILDLNVECVWMVCVVCTFRFMDVLVWMVEMCLSRAQYMSAE